MMVQSDDSVQKIGLVINDCSIVALVAMASLFALGRRLLSGLHL